MHEFAVTENIVQIVQAEALKAGAGRVAEITVVIGELTSFVSESIEFYFQELSRGTLSEGARLRFQNIEASAECSGCGAAFKPGHVLVVCPKCGSGRYQLKQGDEFYIDNIEVAT